MTIRERIELVIHSLRINVFKFKEPEIPKGKWRWTSLMGPDKLVILKNFPINLFIPGSISNWLIKLQSISCFINVVISS